MQERIAPESPEILEKQRENLAEMLLSIGAVELRPDKPFRFSSGILSPIYTNCRLIISDPESRKLTIKMFLQNIQSVNEPFDVVAGTATAGIPYATLIADHLNLPLIYVRNEAKKHGQENQIEGNINKGQSAIVIEDLVSTGKSGLITANAIRNANGKVNNIFSIVTYCMKEAEENFKSNGLRLSSLTDFPTIVKVAENNNYIESKDMRTILEWSIDPTSWGKKMGFEK
jgi:orotate phosphoribosyltransferase